ncbi:MAG: CPXCG motif-containing cysteine-rich protein [Phycisphaerales bacterium]
MDTPADPGAGREQEYTDDCPVCCHPLRVRVRFDASGDAVADATPENA